ncbi:MAG: hypothetical protein GKR89_16525 [Candidatus Latescibacteria bacterium]|nr:hypothetical protein [Candidatus Latescibacterota bacterium]
MRKIALYMGAVLLAVGLGASCTLKYEVLKETSLPNPPNEPIKIYIKQFPVDSKASVVDPRLTADTGATDRRSTNNMANTGNKLLRISRPSRIEDLSGAILRELRKDKVRVFSLLDQIEELDEDNIREIDNPFQLVAAEDAQLEISGQAVINSQRVRKVFSMQTQSVEVKVEVKDLQTEKMSAKNPINVGVVMAFNSRELEEALAIAVVTSMAQKLLF